MQIESSKLGLCCVLSTLHQYTSKCSCVQVISQLGVPVLEDFKENGCRELQLVATALMRFATPFHVRLWT